MPRLIPMPSPRKTNKAGIYIWPMKISHADAMALDAELNSGSRSQSQRFSPDRSPLYRGTYHWRLPCAAQQS
jgi:hypothetical protein